MKLTTYIGNVSISEDNGRITRIKREAWGYPAFEEGILNLEGEVAWARD